MLFSEFALYLCKSARSYGLAWMLLPIFGLVLVDMLDELQKRVCRTSIIQFTTSRWHVSCLSLSYRYCLGRCTSEQAELVLPPYSRGKSTRYSDRLHEFSVTIPSCYKDVYFNSFFPRTARLWNSLPIECFRLTYDINEFRSLNVISFFFGRGFGERVFSISVLYSFHLFLLPFLVISCLCVCSALFGGCSAFRIVNANWKKCQTDRLRKSKTDRTSQRKKGQTYKSTNRQAGKQDKKN